MPEDPDDRTAMNEGYIVTFDNLEGITVGQTDILSDRPSSDLIGNILVTQPSTDPDLTAVSATVTAVTTDPDGNLLSSQIVAVIWVWN